MLPGGPEHMEMLFKCLIWLEAALRAGNVRGAVFLSVQVSVQSKRLYVRSGSPFFYPCVSIY